MIKNRAQKAFVYYGAIRSGFLWYSIMNIVDDWYAVDIIPFRFGEHYVGNIKEAIELLYMPGTYTINRFLVTRTDDKIVTYKGNMNRHFGHIAWAGSTNGLSLGQ